MDVSNLATVELRYTALESLDYASGGQIYGTMEGTLTGDRLNGTLRLTNLAPRRPDNVNLPTLRGIFASDDAVRVPGSRWMAWQTSESSTAPGIHDHLPLP